MKPYEIPETSRTILSRPMGGGLSRGCETSGRAYLGGQEATGEIAGIDEVPETEP